MNKEQLELLDEAFLNYWEKVSINNEEDCLVKQEEGSFLKEVRVLYQQEFINKCKTDNKFSEKWGLKIEERELSKEERVALIQPYGMDALIPKAREEYMKKYNIPTKLITVTYKEKTIESYE